MGYHQGEIVYKYQYKGAQGLKAIAEMENIPYKKLSNLVSSRQGKFTLEQAIARCHKSVTVETPEMRMCRLYQKILRNPKWHA